MQSTLCICGFHIHRLNQPQIKNIWKGSSLVVQWLGRHTSTTGLPRTCFSSVAQSCPTLWNPMECSRPGFPVYHHSQSLLKLMSIESLMPSNHLILCCPLLLPPSVFLSIRVFSNESFLRSGGQSIGVSASASVIPMDIEGWFPLGLTGLISL